METAAEDSGREGRAELADRQGNVPAADDCTGDPWDVGSTDDEAGQDPDYGTGLSAELCSWAGLGFEDSPPEEKGPPSHNGAPQEIPDEPEDIAAEEPAVEEEEEEEDGLVIPTLVYSLPSFDQEPATPEQVVHYLVSNGYLLAALELAVQATDEAAVQQLLLPFFGNPDFFPPDQIAKCTGEDDFRLAAQLKEQARALDALQDKAALSEYELRLAKEDVRELTERLAEDPRPCHHSNGTGPKGDGGQAATLTSIGPHATADPDIVDAVREELNDAVDAYLRSSGYHLAAMAFEDEAAGHFGKRRRGRCGSPMAAQGAGDGELHSLASFFQAFKESGGLKRQAQESAAEAEALRAELEATRRHAAELQVDLNRVDMEARCLRGDIEVLNGQLQALQMDQRRQLQKAGADPAEEGADDAGGFSSTPGSPRRQSAADDAAERPAMSFQWREGTIHAVEALRVVARSLPRIMPSILINARQELLPVLLAVIQEHPEPAARAALSKLLFNLIKKPDQAQRKMIVEGCRELSSRIGPERTMDELLPQCWEQLNDKYPERRILVAEACGQLSPFLSAQIRQSLLLGMLGQLADDDKPSVRASAAANLALILPGLEDKYEQVEEILFQLCTDVSDEVQEASLLVLLPAVVVWARPLGRVCESLIPGVLSRMQSVLETAPTLAGLQGMEAALADLRILGPIQQDQLRVLLQMWVALLEELRAWAAASCPQWVCEAATQRMALVQSPASPASCKLSYAPSVASVENVSQPAPGNPFACATEDGLPGSPGLDAGSNPFEASSNPFEEGPAAEPVPFGGDINPFQEPQGGSRRSSSREPDPNPFAGGLSSNPFADEEPAARDDDGGDAAREPGSELGMAEQGGCSSPRSPADLHQQRAERESAARFAAWAELVGNSSSGDGGSSGGDGQPLPGRWEAAEWLVGEGLPGLISCFRMVHPSECLELLRQDFCACMRATCEMTGSEFAAGVVVPLFTAAISSPAVGEAPEAIKEAARHVMPLSEAAEHVARVTVLPVLLGGVLPCAGREALREYLELMLDEGGDGQQDDAADYQARSWAVEHRGDVSRVLAFAARIDDVQMELLQTMHRLVAAPAAASRQGAALLGTSLAWNLEAGDVERRLLPALTRLTEDRSRKVRLEVVNAVSDVCRRHYRESPSLAAKVDMLLDNLIMERGPQHEVQMAILGRLAEGAPFATPEQLEFLLQKIQWLLSSIAQRSTCGKPPTQLAETATVVFDCLRAVDTSEAELWQHHNLQLHMLSALTCLQREAELLDSARREILSAMLRDHKASTPAMDFVPGDAPFSDGSGRSASSASAGKQQ